MEKIEVYYEELDLLHDRLADKHNFNANRKINMRVQDLQIKRYKIDIQ